MGRRLRVIGFVLSCVAVMFVGVWSGVRDRNKTKSLYDGPLACPLVTPNDFPLLANPSGAKLLIPGFENDLQQRWTETRYRRRRERTRERSRKVGQTCMWIWSKRGEEADRTVLTLNLTNLKLLGGDWRQAPLASTSTALQTDSIGRPAAGWRWRSLLDNKPDWASCTVYQAVGTRFLEVTWTAPNAECSGTVELAKRAGDRLATSVEST